MSVKITLPDGSVKEFQEGVKGIEIAQSISEGLAIGFVVYAALMLGTGRGRNLSLTSWILSALFLLHLIFR